jgi:LysR family transcriptional regulator for metE and metH
VDLAITNEKCECNGAAFLKLFDDELVAVVRTDHRWATKKYITTRQFADEDLVAFDAELNGMDFEANVLAPSGVSPRSVITLPTIEAIVDMVRGGVGVAVLNTWPVRPFLESSELCGVRLTRGGMKRAWYAVVADDDRNPPYIARFIGLLAHQGRS